jgi:ABC-type Mn2+/Zn2+ transport system ATPase subunit
MADAPLLEVTDVETSYGSSRVLFGVSLGVAAGEMVSLMGRNGMGKTTTVKICSRPPATAMVSSTHGPSKKFSRFSRDSRSVPAPWPICFPAASSKCWRSAVR